MLFKKKRTNKTYLFPFTQIIMPTNLITNLTQNVGLQFLLLINCANDHHLLISLQISKFPDNNSFP